MSHRLPLILLSDEGGAVRKLYGVPATLDIMPGRTTYVIDRAGVLRHVFSAALASQKHVAEAGARTLILSHIGKRLGAPGSLESGIAHIACEFQGTIIAARVVQTVDLDRH